MNSEDRFEFDQVRRDQARMRELVGQLDQRIDLLARRCDEPEAVVVPPAPAVPPPNALPPPLPPPTAFAPKPAPAVILPPLPPEPARPPNSAIASQEESLELRVGTYWMSRLGIVILLTGLVFLGNYAYHRIVPFIGAWGRLALLALAGAGLGALGGWLERSREATRNFGRVLLAGGAATLYYTAYAAHFVDALRVIDNPYLGGGMLLALTGAFVYYADRRQSEGVALPAVLLAYFTSSINAISEFTLFSNLLLTAAAVFFLIRHRWTRLSFLCLVATYGSYVFWRLDHLLHVGGIYGEFGVGILFLALYWVLFTVAAFLALPAAMGSATRIAFVTLNNGAFFALAAWHFTAQRPGSFWIFALVLGGVLLALSALAARLRAAERALDGAYLAHGLALVTIGLAAKLTGPQLSVVLAVESAALLVASRARHRSIYEIAAGLCALGACGLTIDSLRPPAEHPQAIAWPVLALLLGDAWWVKRSRGEPESFSGRAAGFAGLGLAILAALIWFTVSTAWQPTAFALVAAVSLGALWMRLPEVAGVGQGFVLLAAGSFASGLFFESAGRWVAFAPVLVVAATGWAIGILAGERTIGGLRVVEVSRADRLIALAMLGAWAFVHVEPVWRVAFYAGCGAAMIVIGALTAHGERRTSGAIYGAVALTFFWARPGSVVHWSELLAIIAIPASLRLGRRLCGDAPLLPAGRDLLVGAAMASLWLWVTRWAWQHDHSGQLTIAWAVLALLIFGAGLSLRERIYRLGGFGVLGLAIGRLFVVDVWRFDTLPRILSFLVLGVVLLALSFVYHRFSEALRRWL